MLRIFKLATLSILAIALNGLPTLHIPAQMIPLASSMHRVTVTAYTNKSRCGKGDPNLTASEVRIRPEHYKKLIALSRDIAKYYDYGARFQLWINKKLYEVAFLDAMPSKHKKKVDLLLPSVRACRQFGRQSGVLIPLNET